VLESITLTFDPSTYVLGTQVRLETLGIAGILLCALLFAALRAGLPRAGLAVGVGGAGRDAPALRRDDLILIAFGAVPGAVVGGRLDYVLIHLDYYQANSNAVLDPGQGGMALTLAVVCGTITALAVGRLLSAPLSRWLGVAAVPVVLALGLGKLATVLGGAGQGQYSDASWATVYAGAGPWESLNPSYPAIPSQAIEGGLILLAVLVVLVVPPVLRLRLRPWRSYVRPGIAPRRSWKWLTGWRRYTTMIGLWALARFAVAFTWRDAEVAGPLNAEQLLLLGVIAAAFLGPWALLLLAALLRATAGGLRLAGAAAGRRRAARRRPADASAEDPGGASDAPSAEPAVAGGKDAG
jgi:hypothetical protein